MAIYVKSATGIDKLNPEVKLYDATGQNTDGAMTQKAVTDKFDKYLKLTGGMIVGNLGVTNRGISTLAISNNSQWIQFTASPANGPNKNTPYSTISMIGTSATNTYSNDVMGEIKLSYNYFISSDWSLKQQYSIILQPSKVSDTSVIPKGSEFIVSLPAKDGTFAMLEDVAEKMDNFVDITTDLDITELTTPGKYRFVQQYDSSRIATNSLTFQNNTFIHYKPSFCYIYVDKTNRFNSPYITADSAYDDSYTYHEGLRVTVKYVSPLEEEIVDVFDMYSINPNGGGK